MRAEARKHIFDAVKLIRQKGFTIDEVRILDAGIDRALKSVDLINAIAAAQPEPLVERSTGLGNAAAFYDHIRKTKMLGPVLTTEEVDGCSAITMACGKAAWPIAWTAYALATAYLETAGTMQPIKEYGGPTYFTRRYDIKGARPDKARELGNLAPGDGAKFCGRGYVQLTGRNNYLKAGQKLGCDLVNKPDLALTPDVAADIMVQGMAAGWFTGKKLADYLSDKQPETAVQFTKARRIINGTDRAEEIAGFAMEFQRALQMGNWG